MTEELIGGFLAAVPMAAVMVDQSERFIGANPQGLALVGDNILGRHYATILRQPSVAEAIEACLRDQQPQEARHLASDAAQDVRFAVTCRYVPGVGARAQGAVLACFEDISEREQAGQMRRDFVANVSHELRTPLTALLGFIETLRGAARDDTAARDRFLTIMEGEASRMNRLVGDLLSLSRVEAQERVRPRALVDLNALLAATLKTLAPVAEASASNLHLDAPATAVKVAGDPDQLQQVFTNLVENAIKYGGGGAVRVTLSEVPRDPGLRAAAAAITVSDDGPGIDPVHLPRLTERFYRADSHRSRALGGTGLGLAIVKHIVNRHRGRLRMDSTLGEGSVFTVILPR